MIDIATRYKMADAAFAVSHSGGSEQPHDQEWGIYLEWADATTDYVRYLADIEREEHRPVATLTRIRRVLSAQQTVGSLSHPRLKTLFAAAFPAP